MESCCEHPQVAPQMSCREKNASSSNEKKVTSQDQYQHPLKLNNYEVKTKEPSSSSGSDLNKKKITNPKIQAMQQLAPGKKKSTANQTLMDSLPYQVSSKLSSNQAENLIRRQKLLSSKQFQSALNQETDFQKLMKIAGEAVTLQAYQESKMIYIKIKKIIENKETQKQYSQEALLDLSLFVNSEILNIAITQKKVEEAEEYFAKCQKLYEILPKYKLIQQQITVLNNYAIFCRNNSQKQRAINLFKKAFQLEDKYYTNNDERKYATLTNLACLYYECGQYEDAKKTSETIVRQCKDKQIKELAKSNQSYYEKIYRKTK